MEAYLRFVLRHRALALAAVLAISGLFAFPLRSAVVASSPAKLFFGDDPDFARWKTLAKQFGNDELILVGLEAPDLFTPAKLDAIARVVRRIERVPHVARVDSLPTAPRVRARGGDLEVGTYADHVRSSTLSAAALLAEAQEDELVAGTLLAKDGRATAVIVELTVNTERSAEEVPAVIEAVRSAFLAEGFRAEELVFGGIVPNMSACVEAAYFTLRRITPIVVGLLLLVTYALFRRVWPATITGGLAGLGVLWAMGLAVAIDPEINILLAMVPGVMMVVSFSDVVHLSSAYLMLLERGVPKDDAVIQAGVEVGRACFLTSLTTFFGFVSLIFVPTPAIRQFGVVLGFGVGAALLLALTVVPILFSLLPAPALHRGSTRRRLDPARAIVDGAQALTRRSPRAVVAAFGVVMVASLFAVLRLDVAIDFAKRFDRDHPVARAEAYFADRFAGAMPLDLFITADSAERLRDPEVLAAVERFERALERRADVRSATSLADVVRRLHGELSGEGGLPASAALVAQTLLLFEVSGGSGLSRLVDDDGARMRVLVRLGTSEFRASRATGDEAAALARTFLPPDLKIEALGGAYLFGRFADQVIVGQARGLGFGFAVIALTMVLAFGSLRVGLWSMLPNVLPLLALGAAIYGLYTVADSDLMLVALIGIGIGVDDTIHFLSRLRIEAARGVSRREAIDASFAFAGRAMVMTTIIIVLGFLPFATSAYFSTQVFGTLLPFTLVVALVGDLLLLPALAELGLLRFGPDR